jgi:hypothetical protein
MKQKGFAPIIILILLVLVGGAYYFGITKNKTVPSLVVPVQPSSSPVAQPIADPTANWKTYTNKEYGFTVKYPSDAKLRISQSESSDRMLVVAFDSPNAIFDHLFKSGGYSFEISMQTQKNFNTLDEYLSFQKEHSMYENILPKTYNNVIGYLFKNDKGYSGLNFIYQGFVAKNNDLFYTINYFTDEDLDMFNQILSTFKFTQ